MEKFSVLVKRVVNVRIDNIQADSHSAAINIAETADFNELIENQKRAPWICLERENPDGTKPRVRYVEDGDESIEYLVDEADDEEFDRSEWYKADGVTPVSMDQRITNN